MINLRNFCAGGVGTGILGAGALTSLAYPQPAHASGGFRSFDVMRGEDKIGEHRIDVSVSEDGLQTNAATDISVKLLGITVYRYALSYSEQYDRDGKLLSLSGQADENGKSHRVLAQRVGSIIDIAGTKYTGTITGSAVPTSYWRAGAVDSDAWISTQDGRIYRVSTAPSSAPEAPEGTARSVRVSDGDAFSVDLFYDASGEWIGSAFDAKGERAMFRLRDSSGALNI